MTIHKHSQPADMRGARRSVTLWPAGCPLYVGRHESCVETSGCLAPDMQAGRTTGAHPHELPGVLANQRLHARLDVLPQRRVDAAARRRTEPVACRVHGKKVCKMSSLLRQHC